MVSSMGKRKKKRYYTESVFGPQLLFPQADSKLDAKAVYTAPPIVLFTVTFGAS